MSDKPYSIMMWGHDFAPVTKDGKQWPCDDTYTLGGCDKQAQTNGASPDQIEACKNNAKLLAKKTGNNAWIAKKDEYFCPEEIAKESDSCYTDCAKGKLINGKCTQGVPPWTPPFELFKTDSYPVDPKHPNKCNKCAECWDPSLGGTLFEMFDMVCSRDDIWHAHFVEIVQYMYNKKFSSLIPLSFGKNEIVYRLVTGDNIKQIRLCVSLMGNPKKAYVSGQSTTIFSGKYGSWINVFITSNQNYIVKVVF